MSRKAIAIEAYLSGYSSRAAARLSGLSSSYIRELANTMGVSRPVGRPRRSIHPKGAGSV